MWFRLKIGKIRFIEDEYALMYAMKNENKIKKQGDNLIDVLEVRDIVLTKSGKRKILEYINVEKGWINGHWQVKDIDKVITHEQLKGLEQTV